MEIIRPTPTDQVMEISIVQMSKPDTETKPSYEPQRTNIAVKLIKKCSKVSRYEGEVDGKKFTIYIPLSYGSASKMTVDISAQPNGGIQFELTTRAKTTGDDAYMPADSNAGNWEKVYLPQKYRQFNNVFINIA